MANVLENIISGPGFGNSVLFGNEVKASIELVSRHTCCQKTISMGVNAVLMEEIVAVGGVNTLEAFRAPVITLNTETNTSLTDLALTRPNQTVPRNGCETVSLIIINSSGQDQVFSTDVEVSRVVKSDTNPVMGTDCAYMFYYDFNDDLWHPSNNLFANI